MEEETGLVHYKDFRMEQISDDDLIRLYCDGDAEAFDTLFDRHYVSVYNFARMMLGDSSGADEVLQDAFLALAQNVKHYTPRGRFRPWMMRIVRNLCLNRIQAERIQRVTLGRSEIGLVNPASGSPGPAETLDADEQRTIIRAAIAELPDNQREAIALYAFEQMSYREIADVMNSPINTIKTLIHRARVSLAQKLESRLQE